MKKLVEYEAFKATVKEIAGKVKDWIATARQDLAKISVKSNKVLPEHLPYPVYVFNKVEETKTPQGILDKITGTVDVVYYVAVKRFFASKDNKLYKDWDTRDQYMSLEATDANSQPLRDRLYKCTKDGELYEFNDQDVLVPVTDFGSYIKSSEFSFMSPLEGVAIVNEAFANS
ncbi:MAG: hypothetical protein K2K81_07415 [Muribaculaceae bacterium]|nr:hypothetical protein [Muribaculaceae bacterium]